MHRSLWLHVSLINCIKTRTFSSISCFPDHCAWYQHTYDELFNGALTNNKETLASHFACFLSLLFNQFVIPVLVLVQYHSVEWFRGEFFWSNGSITGTSTTTRVQCRTSTYFTWERSTKLTSCTYIPCSLATQARRIGGKQWMRLF